jgi:methylated-DNA-[protein]-cysteine S-methyltransferase
MGKSGEKLGNSEGAAASATISTPLGPIRLTWAAETLQAVDLGPECGVDAERGAPAALAAELTAYFADPGHRFELPIELAGTPFQRRVWQALRAIPPGRTRTYGDLAAELGTSPRAVGGACRANPCPIVVPCHRVVGATGLGGFAGDRSGRKLDVKRWLLRHEGADIPA